MLITFFLVLNAVKINSPASSPGKSIILFFDFFLLINKNNFLHRHQLYERQQLVFAFSIVLKCDIELQMPFNWYSNIAVFEVSIIASRLQLQ